MFAMVSVLVFVFSIPGVAAHPDAVSLLQQFLRPHIKSSHPYHHHAHRAERVPAHSFSASGRAEHHAEHLASLASTNHSITVEDGRNPSKAMWVAVPSSPHNTQKRDSIRNTWKKFERELNGAVEVKFILCSDGYNEGVRKQLMSEHERYGDTITLDCSEGYFHGMLTKKVYSAMKYFLDHVDGRFDTFMKADDDAFLFLPQIYHAVKQNTAANFYMGQMLDPEEPFRSPDHKWYEPVENWPEKMWPRAASGSGYVLDRPLLERMLIDDTLEEKLLLYNEDKAVGAWVKYEVEQRGQRVEFVDLPGKDGLPSTPKPLLIYHHIGVSVMNCLWRQVAVRKRSVDVCRS